MSYYHDYLAVEFGMFPHEVWRAGRTPGDPLGYTNLMDFLWQRSPLRYAARVRTPTMFIHGENDNDVPIAEAEQFYIALKDVGVETVMIRYPREGHGTREMRHVVDVIDRSLDWYGRHFGRSESRAGAR
jgi:dipeptidyl aminopeptidase/acylaminoacyl peptidase